MEKGLIYLLIGIGYLIYKGYMKKKELDEQKNYTPPPEPEITEPTTTKKSATNFEELFGEMFSEFKEPKKKTAPKPKDSSEPIIEKVPEQNFNIEENAYQASMLEKAKAVEERSKFKKAKKAKTVGTIKKSVKVFGTSPREAYKHHILFQRKFT